MAELKNTTSSQKDGIKRDSIFGFEINEDNCEKFLPRLRWVTWSIVLFAAFRIGECFWGWIVVWVVQPIWTVLSGILNLFGVESSPDFSLWWFAFLATIAGTLVVLYHAIDNMKNAARVPQEDEIRLKKSRLLLRRVFTTWLVVGAICSYLLGQGLLRITIYVILKIIFWAIASYLFGKDKIWTAEFLRYKRQAAKVEVTSYEGKINGVPIDVKKEESDL